MAREKTTRSSRKKGSSSDTAMADLRRLAQHHGPAVIEALVDMALHGKAETARVAAMRELLDRGYGKSKPLSDPSETHDATPPAPPRLVIQPLSSLSKPP